MTIELNGPALIPQDPTAAVVLLHGFGSDGDDLIQLAPMLDAALPAELQRRVAYFAPHGLAPTSFGQGYQWFSDSNWTFKDRAGIGRAREALAQFIEMQIVQELGLLWSKVVVIGFSQGAMTALFAAPRWPHQVAGVVAHSGRLMWEQEAEVTQGHKPPLLLLHGQNDDVVNADDSVRAAESLQNLGFDADLHLLEGLGHGIDQRSLAHMAVFMGSVLAGE